MLLASQALVLFASPLPFPRPDSCSFPHFPPHPPAGVHSAETGREGRLIRLGAHSPLSSTLSQGLKPMDFNGLADPYVKLHLLPGACKVMASPSPVPRTHSACGSVPNFLLPPASVHHDVLRTLRPHTLGQ